MKILVVVDMQNDFIDGALGTKEAVSIVPRVVEKIRQFDGRVLYTRDTHEENYLETQEGRNLPVEKAGEAPLDKPTFGSCELGQLLKAQDDDLKKQGELGIESITLIGLCTDICVISNAMIVKAFLPEVPVKVDAACCAGVTPESHKNALEAMKVCQIEVTE